MKYPHTVIKSCHTYSPAFLRESVPPPASELLLKQSGEKLLVPPAYFTDASACVAVRSLTRMEKRKANFVLLSLIEEKKAGVNCQERWPRPSCIYS